jgi:large subunit ribosomal protein LP1
MTDCLPTAPFCHFSGPLDQTYACCVTPHSPSTRKQADKIVAITSSASVEVEPIWASLLAKALEGKDVKSMLTNIGAGGGAPAAAAPGAAAGGAAAAGGDAPAAEEKKEEAKEGKSIFERLTFKLVMMTDGLCVLLILHPQSPTTTWDSDCSTKQFRHLHVRPFFPSQHKTFPDPIHEIPSFCHPTTGSRGQGSIDKLLLCTGSFGLVLAFVPAGVECWIYEYGSRWRSTKGFGVQLSVLRKSLS